MLNDCENLTQLLSKMPERRSLLNCDQHCIDGSIVHTTDINRKLLELVAEKGWAITGYVMAGA